jgi:hypothetical protein
MRLLMQKEGISFEQAKRQRKVPLCGTPVMIADYTRSRSI